MRLVGVEERAAWLAVVNTVLGRVLTTERIPGSPPDNPLYFVGPDLDVAVDIAAKVADKVIERLKKRADIS